MLRDVVPHESLPEPYHLLWSILQDGTREWRAELWGGIPDEAVTWQVRPGGPSIGAIMLHIIIVEIFWIQRFALDIAWNEDEAEQLMVAKIDVDEERWPIPHHHPLAWYFDLHDKVRQRTLEALQRWPAATATKPHDGDEITMRWVLGHVIQHESYHGGQIVQLYNLYKHRSLA